MIPVVAPRSRSKLLRWVATVRCWLLLDSRHWPHRWTVAQKYADAGLCPCRRCRRARRLWPCVDRSQLERDRFWWATQ